MAIPSERYELHKEDTNVGVADLGTTNVSGLLNSANNTIVEATDSLKSLIDTDLAGKVKDIKSGIAKAQDTVNGVKADIKGKLDAVKQVRDQVRGAVKDVKNAVNSVKNTVKSYRDAVNGLVKAGKAAVNEVKSDLKALEESITKDPLVREVKGVLGDLRDVSKMNSQEIENVIIGSIYNKDPKVRAAISKLGIQCKTTTASMKGSGKPYESRTKCNGKDAKSGGNGSCDSKVVVDAVNAVTGKADTAQAAQHKDPNEAMSTIVAMSKISYEFGMCGVFESLGGKFLNEKVASHGLLGKAAAVVLAKEASKGKLSSVFDQVKSQTSLGHSVTGALPDAGKMVVDNTKARGQYKESEFPSVAASLRGSVTALTPSTGGEVTGLNALYGANTFNRDYLELQQAGALKAVDINTLPDKPSDFMIDLTRPQSNKVGSTGLGIRSFGNNTAGNPASNLFGLGNTNVANSGYAIL